MATKVGLHHHRCSVNLHPPTVVLLSVRISTFFESTQRSAATNRIGLVLSQTVVGSAFLLPLLLKRYIRALSQ
jgi:hypothetical protein